MLTLQSRIDHLQSVLRVDSSTDRHADGRPNMRKVSLILSSCRLLRQFARVYGGTGNCTPGFLNAAAPGSSTLFHPTIARSQCRRPWFLTPSFMQYLPPIRLVVNIISLLASRATEANDPPSAVTMAQSTPVTFDFYLSLERRNLRRHIINVDPRPKT